MIVLMEQLTDTTAITAASVRLVIIVTAVDPVFLVQQVFRKEPKLVLRADCLEFVKEKNDRTPLKLLM